ncbi:unnamed protein product [Durusdinium trenchii]|uniref:ABC1 atypical kinase-like domain-containing protein n=1 Tax=Durusdinium trenchii TaxID=1381693 RepID=A0ABP0KYV3_9DINO
MPHAGDVRWVPAPKAVVQSDLFIVRCLDNILSLIFKEEGFSMAWAIDEFEKTVSTELDFREEAQHADRCRAFFRAHRGSGKLRGGRIVVPGIHHDLTTQRVLVMDFSRGLPIARLTAAVRKCREGGTTELTWEEERAAEAAPEAARLLAEAFGAMCFSEGFLHCDPHPGNLLVELPQAAEAAASSVRLVILDHGLYCELSNDRRQAMCELWEAMILQDSNQLISSSHRLGIDEATAELLPLYFTNRSMSTYAGLGQPITLEEKDRLKQQLLESGVLPEGGGSVAMAGLALLADRLPADFLMVMRTMHLVAALHRDLGGTAAERFACYAAAASHGRWERTGWMNAWFQPRLFHLRWSLKEAGMKLHAPHAGREHFSIARCLAELGNQRGEKAAADALHSSAGLAGHSSAVRCVPDLLGT